MTTDEKYDRILDKLETLAVVIHQTNKNTKAIDGNGRTGLKGRVSTLGTQVKFLIGGYSLLIGLLIKIAFFGK